MSPSPLPRRAVLLAPSSLALVLRRRPPGSREAVGPEAEAEADCCEDEARGAAVFQAFRRANAASHWNAGLARAVGRVRLQGWLRGGVLLLQGPPAPLQLLRDAWLRRALRAPKGFLIRAVDDDEKTILNLENLNKNLSTEIKEVKKELSQLQENLKISEDTNLQFEGQLTKTIKGLATVMDEIHTVLKKDSVKNEDKDQTSKENGANI